MPFDKPMSPSRRRVLDALSHRQPDRVPVDFGACGVTGMHVSCVAALREHYGLDQHPVKVWEPYQMLGLIEDDLRDAIGVDVKPVHGRTTMFGFENRDWRPWTFNGLEVLVPGGFQTTLDPDTGSTLIYPQGDRSAEPSGRMPKDGFFFDGIVRSGPVDLDTVGPEGNMEDVALLSDAALDAIEEDVRAANAGGDAVFASVVDTGLGDIAMVPGMKLIAPAGVREIADWYMLTAARPDVVAAIFDNVVEIGIENYRRLHARVGDMIDVIYLCGTDFGTQTSAFCSVRTFDTLWRPHYARLCDWVHANTGWKTFKHSCGSVERFYESMIEAGIDIVNPVQCSAAGMDPRLLKEKYGGRLVFWGGGIDTQQVLPFGTPAEVREQVLERLDIFSEGGGYVFNAIHNVQALTPVENIVAMIDAVHEFNGR
ncbi:uroporphyrinogen decarboxylase family protein [Palleronia sp. KMU-117]|uniref:uroporphyrinogen decarboxylase family protein n=1 Tax=Palleronia sp. KMU-117 TaxID=3434108 RepID=UPI003D73F5C7